MKSVHLPFIRGAWMLLLGVVCVIGMGVGMTACMDDADAPETKETFPMTEMETDTIASRESDTTPESVILPDTAPPASETTSETASEVETIPETVSEVETTPETAPEVETTPETAPEVETTPETAPEVETTDYEQYVKTHGYAFLYHEAGVAEPYQITNRKITATRIAVAPDCFLSSVTTFTFSWGDNIGQMDFCLWRWDTDYATTTATEPVYTRTLVDTVDCTWVTINLPAKTVGEGEWLFEFRNGSENAIGVALVNGAAPSPDSHVTVVEGFDRGRTTSKLMQSYVSYEAYDTATLVTPPDPADYTHLSEGKAHVILLAGQSNATGQSLCALLENHVTADQLARYRAGYENILIDYNSDGQARSNGFVPVKLGQSAGIDRFGPEVGLADYLSRVYPEETFYIIKSSFSGSNLYADWAETGFASKQFMSDVTNSLYRLKRLGLEPEIFAMLWMQGESDAWVLDQTFAYGAHEEELLGRINDRFGTYMAPGGMAFLDAGIYEGIGTPWTYAPLLNNMKRNHAHTSPNFYYLDTNTPDIDPRDENNDIAHYDSDDMIELGELFGEFVGQVLTHAQYGIPMPTE